MSADVAAFSKAAEGVCRSFAAQGAQLERQEQQQLGRSERERGLAKEIEQRFQQQLQRAHAAFRQEFRNHSVVIESEVKRIHTALTERLEEKYGAQIKLLREQLAVETNLAIKRQDEIAKLKAQIAEQEASTTAMKQRLGLDKKEELRDEIQHLKEELGAAARGNANLSQQLTAREELAARLSSDLSRLEAELKKQADSFEEERRGYDEVIRGLRAEMSQQQEQFREHLKDYHDHFVEYRARTTAELQIQEILGSRRLEALAQMEEERQRHIQARAKPTPRIGAEEEARTFRPYELAKDTRYRVDDMGMDTSWRDYRVTAPGKPQQKDRSARRRAEQGQRASSTPVE